MQTNTETTASQLSHGRPPIVAVVGHIDHGKSTLLDYIRKSNTAAGEAGGITQHLSAYEAIHTTPAGVERHITFLDTPGHAAFEAMRSRGLNAADVAILVVSAEDGVKPQTVEAVKLIVEANIPYVVAFSKIDKPGADLERAKMSLLEHGVYLEGLGGDIAYVAISSKTGEGIPELLDLILLAAELEGVTADPALPGSGLVIEAHVDAKRGNTATLIVKNGTVLSGQYVVSGESFAPVRIMENYIGKKIKNAHPGTPVRVVGFSTLPDIGAGFITIETKKEAEEHIAQARLSRVIVNPEIQTSSEEEKIRVILPLVIKTDFAGTGDAVKHELELQPIDERMEVRIVQQSVGSISENDVKLAGAGVAPGIIVGFNVKIEPEARQLAERLGVAVKTFDIIYELTEWLQEEITKRIPREHMDEKIGQAKILKVFSFQQGKVVLGGRLETGTLSERAAIKIMRDEVEIARGEVVSLQVQKNAVKKAEAPTEFGAMLSLPTAPNPGDYIEIFEVVFK